MPSRVDLSGLPVVDAHCHGWSHERKLAQDPAFFLDRVTLTGACLTASFDGRPLTSTAPEELQRLTDASPFALALRRRLAAHLGCEPTRAAVSAARHEAYAADPEGYQRALWRDAAIVGLCVEDGSPRIASADMAREAGLPVHRVARIEVWIEQLRADCESFGALEERFRACAEEAAAERLTAFKSIIGYLVGLDVRAWPRAEVEAAYARWRANGFVETREDAKPVRDTLLLETLAVARATGTPVHLHSGAGDSSIILEHARPKDLFGLLKEHTDQPIVLIHSGWPWVEEGAYLAGVFPEVHLDTSVTTPWYALAVDQKLEVLLSTASPAKVMHGSDHHDPEAIWLTALLAREALERVLSRAVEHGWLEAADGRRIGAGVLARNVARLHGIELPSDAAVVA